jgi:protein disulfide-isomerase
VSGPTNRVATATRPSPETPGPSIYSQNNYAAYARRDAATAAQVANNTPAASNALAMQRNMPPAMTLPVPQAGPPLRDAAPNMVPVGGSPAPVPNRGSSPPAQFVSAQQPMPPNVNPVGLDGFCPVTLIERSRTAPEDPRCWVRGDPRWGAVHRGITYLFNGAEEQKRFLANPDFYAPALSGNDAVLAFDRGRLIRGRREFGTFCDGRIYLFASKETLESFQKDYQRFVDEVRQAENPQHAAVR